MGTEKPQFSCYLDPIIDAEIKAHLKLSGQAKGKFMEQLWRFYNLRDNTLLYDKLASRFTKDVEPMQRIWAQRIVNLLQRILKGEAE